MSVRYVKLYDLIRARDAISAAIKATSDRMIWIPLIDAKVTIESLMPISEKIEVMVDEEADHAPN